MNEPESKMQFGELLSGFSWAIKYALAVGIATFLFLSDSQDYGRGIIWRPDKALFWGFTVLIVLGGGRALTLWAYRTENEKLSAEIEVNKRAPIKSAPVDLSVRIGKRMADEEFIAEIQNVERYEVRRTRAANFAMMSIGKSQGPLRVRAGQFAYDAPEVWRSTGAGTLVVSNRRMVWLGTTRRQEWRWSVVGDVIPDRNGLLVFGRSGRPVGLKMQPEPKVFAYIEQQLGI